MFPAFFYERVLSVGLAEGKVSALLAQQLVSVLS